jgi:hypothetical protein
VTDTPIRDILINARQEAARMQHYFIGVEHLVVGALELRDGIGASLLEQYGFRADYVIDAIRRHSGKGSRQRLWAGLPNSPRCQMVLSIAQDLALEAGRDEIAERDLLLAVLEEGDSIPVRVWHKLSLDLTQFASDIRQYVPVRSARQPYVNIDFSSAYSGDALDEQQLFVLRRMFHGYSQVRIERRLTGGYTGALVLAVTPVRADGLEDAPVAVKIDLVDTIMDEALRYDTQIKNTLPPLTARLEDRPTVAETTDLGGLKYTFVAGSDRKSHDMRAAIETIGIAQLGPWVKSDLYPTFGRTWWMQRRPYRFQAWEEYDWLLPAALTLEPLPESAHIPDDAHLIREPVRRSTLREIEYGAIVVISGFTVHKVDRERQRLQLTVGSGVEAARRAHRLEVRALDLAKDTHYRGELIDQIAGRVFGTRQETLFNAVRALSPDFDVSAAVIPVFLTGDRLPNPLLVYEALLDYPVQGTISKLHGDLHLGNVLLGPNNSPFLIDFAHARDGHTLFDWANLEISLMADVVLPRLRDESWAAVRRILARAAGLAPGRANAVDPPLDEAFSSLEALRDIVTDCLLQRGAWAEYWIALFFCALRAVTWDTMSIGGRRLMFLLAAYAAQPLLERQPRGGFMETPTQLDTDFTDLSTDGR